VAHAVGEDQGVRNEIGANRTVSTESIDYQTHRNKLIHQHMMHCVLCCEQTSHVQRGHHTHIDVAIAHSHGLLVHVKSSQPRECVPADHDTD
jgi:hypothetical protein